MLVEEASAIAWRGTNADVLLNTAEALSLLELPAIGDPPATVQNREIGRALSSLRERADELNAFAERRAQDLLADHRRVREAAQARGTYTVKPLLPPDIIGVFVLLPETQ
jgi:hypothetical protein